MAQTFAEAAAVRSGERRKRRSFAWLLYDFNPVPVGVLQAERAPAGQGLCGADQAPIARGNAQNFRSLPDGVECGAVARHQREVQHRAVVHLQFVVLNQADVVVVKTKAEKMHLHVREPHGRAAVGMIEGRELQVEELRIKVLRSLQVADIDDVVLQLGSRDRCVSNWRVHCEISSRSSIQITQLCCCRSAFGSHVRVAGKAGKWIEASQVVTAIETLGDKAVRANEDTTNSVALGPGEEGLILALERLRRRRRGSAVDGQETRVKSVENR